MGLGNTADIIVHGCHIVSEKALALGFRFPALEPALRDLLAQVP